MTADSTPTPATGLSISMLVDQARGLANKAESLIPKHPEHTNRLAELASTLGAVASGFTELQHTRHGDEEGHRAALVSELFTAREFIRRITEPTTLVITNNPHQWMGQSGVFAVRPLSALAGRRFDKVIVDGRFEMTREVAYWFSCTVFTRARSIDA